MFEKYYNALLKVMGHFMLYLRSNEHRLSPKPMILVLHHVRLIDINISFSDFMVSCIFNISCIVINNFQYMKIFNSVSFGIGYMGGLTNRFTDLMPSCVYNFLWFTVETKTKLSYKPFAQANVVLLSIPPERKSLALSTYMLSVQYFGAKY